MSLQTHLAAAHCAIRRRRRGKSRALIIRLCVLSAMMIGLGAARALAQAPMQVSDDELAVRAEDPTAPLLAFEVADWYQASLYDKDGTVNQAVFRAVLPFTVGSVDNIFRLTQQDTQAYDNKLGGSDPELVYLAGSGVSWGRWGIGAVLEPPWQ